MGGEGGRWGLVRRAAGSYSAGRSTHRGPAMITKLYVDNYKCLQNLELALGPVAILMGRNGSGKSAVFDILHALQMIVCRDARPAAFFGASTQTRWSTQQEQTVELTVEDPRPDAGVTRAWTYRLTVQHDAMKGEPRVLDEILVSGGQTLFHFERGDMRLYRDDGSPGPEFPGDWRHSGLARVMPRPDNRRLTRFKDWLSGLVVARPNPAALGGRAPGEDALLAPDLGNFASWYRHLSQARPRLVYEAVSALAEVLPGFEDVGIRVDEQRVGWLRARLGAPGAAAYTLDFDQLSDGQRVLLALQVVLAHHADARGPLALDEPDNYLALAEVQPLLMRALDTALDGDGAQLLVISHHPEFLNQLAPDHGLVFYREGGGPTRVKPFTSDAVLPAAELIARGVGDV